MIAELLYTSSKMGLRSGSRGFFTVMETKGIPSALIERLESFSSYRHLFDPGSQRNPVVSAFRIVEISGTTWYVLSRVADHGADYSGRSNLIAHHVALSEDEIDRFRESVAPSSLMRGGVLFRTRYDGEPRWIAPEETRDRLENARKRILAASMVPSTWNRLTADPCWAAAWLDSTLRHSNEPISLVYPLGTDVLALFDETLRLMPVERRWTIPFMTFYTKSLDKCLWRGYCDLTDEARAVRETRKGFVIDLGSLPLPPPTGIDAACREAVRTGIPLVKERKKNEDDSESRVSAQAIRPSSLSSKSRAKLRRSGDEIESDVFDPNGEGYETTFEEIDMTSSTQVLKPPPIDLRPPPLPHQNLEMAKSESIGTRWVSWRTATLALGAAGFLLIGFFLGYLAGNSPQKPYKNEVADSSSASTQIGADRSLSRSGKTVAKSSSADENAVMEGESRSNNLAVAKPEISSNIADRSIEQPKSNSESTDKTEKHIISKKSAAEATLLTERSESRTATTVKDFAEKSIMKNEPNIDKLPVSVITEKTDSKSSRSLAEKHIQQVRFETWKDGKTKIIPLSRLLSKTLDPETPYEPFLEGFEIGDDSLNASKELIVVHFDPDYAGHRLKFDRIGENIWKVIFPPERPKSQEEILSLTFCQVRNENGELLAQCFDPIEMSASSKVSQNSKITNWEIKFGGQSNSTNSISIGRFLKPFSKDMNFLEFVPFDGKRPDRFVMAYEKRVPRNSSLFASAVSDRVTSDPVFPTVDFPMEEIDPKSLRKIRKPKLAVLLQNRISSTEILGVEASEFAILDSEVKVDKSGWFEFGKFDVILGSIRKEIDTVSMTPPMNPPIDVLQLANSRGFTGSKPEDATKFLAFRANFLEEYRDRMETFDFPVLSYATNGNVRMALGSYDGRSKLNPGK